MGDESGYCAVRLYVAVRVMSSAVVRKRGERDGEGRVSSVNDEDPLFAESIFHARCTHSAGVSAAIDLARERGYRSALL